MRQELIKMESGEGAAPPCHHLPCKRKECKDLIFLGVAQITQDNEVIYIDSLGKNSHGPCLQYK